MRTPLFNMEARDDSFVVALTRPNGRFFPIFSYLIRFLESFYAAVKEYKKSGKFEFKLQDFSHVIVLWKTNKHNRIIAYEASGTAVNMVNYENIKNHIKIIKLWRLSDLTDNARDSAVVWCMDNAGKDYALLQSLGTVYAKSLELIISKPVKNPFSNGDYMQYCIELIARFIKANYVCSLDIDFENSITRDVIEIMSSVKDVVELNLEEIILP